MEELTSANTGEVAVPEGTAEAPTDIAVQTRESEKQETKVDQRDLERDSAFAKLRREAEAAKRENDRLKELLPEERSEDIPEEIQNAVESSELQSLKSELAEFKKREGERILSDDLKLLRDHYDDLKVSDVSELGIDFIRLRALGIDPIVAYEAVSAGQSAGTKERPVSTGRVKVTGGSSEREYYTPEEVDRLTERELSSERVFEKVMKSMQKWTKKG